MKKTNILLFALLALLAGCIHAARTEPVSQEGNIHEEVLSNGLKVIVLKDPSAPLAVFQIWYDAGSINEPIGRTGLSHLLEHMMFKGTSRYGPKMFSQIIKRAGGIDNAGTSKDFVYYYQKLAPDRLSLSIEMEADRMRNLIMDPQDMLAERNVVMEERRMRYDDDPQNLVYEEVVATAFKNHPYRWPVIGWMEDLQRITRDDLWNYYRTRYAPNNAFIIVAGNIDVPSIMAKIKQEFGEIPPGPAIRKLDVVEPEQRGEKRVSVRKEAELPYVLSAYKVPSLPEKDSYALDVLAAILSGGKSARIYRRLIDEKRIALSAGAGYSSTDRFPFLFYLYGTALPGKSIEEVEKGLYEEVEKIKTQPPSEMEMQKAMNQIESDFIMNQDSIFYQAMILAEFELLGDWRMRDAYLPGIQSVTAEDVQRVAQKYLIADRRTVGILIPVKNNKSK